LNAARKILKYHKNYFRTHDAAAYARVAREAQVLDQRMKHAMPSVSASVFFDFPSRPKGKLAAAAFSASADITNTLLDQLIHAVRALISVIAETVSMLLLYVTHANYFRPISMFLPGLVLIRKIPRPAPTPIPILTVTMTINSLPIGVGILVSKRRIRKVKKMRKNCDLAVIRDFVNN
jgi:hypothetical protein